MALGCSSLCLNAPQWEGKEEASLLKVPFVQILPRAELNTFCGFPWTPPCLLGLPRSTCFLCLGDAPLYAWQSFFLNSGCPVPFSQASEQDLRTVTSLACSCVDASHLCHSKPLKLVQLWHIVLLGMWAVSVYQSSLRFHLKLVRSPFLGASFLGRIDLPFAWLSFSFAAALKSQWWFLNIYQVPNTLRDTENV